MPGLTIRALAISASTTPVPAVVSILTANELWEVSMMTSFISIKTFVEPTGLTRILPLLFPVIREFAGSPSSLFPPLVFGLKVSPTLENLPTLVFFKRRPAPELNTIPFVAEPKLCISRLLSLIVSLLPALIVIAVPVVAQKIPKSNSAINIDSPPRVTF